MEKYLKIEKDKLNSVFAKYRHLDKNGIIDDILSDLFEASTTEVSTYTEDEFLKEKRRFLTAKAMGKINKHELKILKEMSATLRLSENGS